MAGSYEHGNEMLVSMRRWPTLNFSGGEGEESLFHFTYLPAEISSEICAILFSFLVVFICTTSWITKWLFTVSPLMTHNDFYLGNNHSSWNIVIKWPVILRLRANVAIVNYEERPGINRKIYQLTTAVVQALDVVRSFHYLHVIRRESYVLFCPCVSSCEYPYRVTSMPAFTNHQGMIKVKMSVAGYFTISDGTVNEQKTSTLPVNNYGKT